MCGCAYVDGSLEKRHILMSSYAIKTALELEIEHKLFFFCFRLWKEDSGNNERKNRTVNQDTCFLWPGNDIHVPA